MEFQTIQPNARTGSLTVAVTTSSQAVAIPNGGGIVYSFQNRGGGDAAVEFGTSNQVQASLASAGNYGSTPVLANIPIQLMAPVETTHIGVIGGANCTLYITRGQIA